MIEGRPRPDSKDDEGRPDSKDDEGRPRPDSKDDEGRPRPDSKKDDQSFDVVGVDHVQVTAPQELVDDTCDWYRSCLGLQEMPKPEGTRPGGAWFRAGDQEIHVSVDEHNPHKAAHFGLAVTDFGAIVERLRSAGCHIEQASAIPGRHRCYTRDPAGNRIEIVAFDARAATAPPGAESSGPSAGRSQEAST